MAMLGARRLPPAGCARGVRGEWVGVRRAASGTRRRVGERSEPSQTRLRACVCTRMQGKISCIARKIRGVQEISTEIAVRYY